MLKQEDIDNNIPINSQNETNSIASLFEARKFYYENTINFVKEDILKQVAEKATIREIPFSDLYNNNALYGVVDYQGDVVVPINDNKYFGIVGSNNGKNLRLQNFVADAFLDMRNYLNRQIIKNPLSKESAYYNIQVKKAYESIDDLYQTIHLITANKFRNYALNNKELDAKISDYVTFNKEYVKFLEDHLGLMPVTKSGVAVSLNLEIFSSGLMFSISDDSTGNDVNKYIKYFLDEGFICFSEACERFGFKFDKNIPFILYADINSPAMKPYLQKYGIQNGEDVFTKRFKKLYLEDVDQLKLMFYNSYNTFLVDNLYYGEDYSKVCSRDASKTIFKERKPAIFSEYTNEFLDTYWLKIYIYFKNLETNRGLTKNEFDNLLKVSRDLLRYNKKTESLRIINAKFNETKGIKYFDSLLQNQEVIQQDSSTKNVDKLLLIL